PRAATLLPYTTLFRSGCAGGPERGGSGGRFGGRCRGSGRVGGRRRCGGRVGGRSRGGRHVGGRRGGRRRVLRSGEDMRRRAKRRDRKSTRLNSSHVKI